MKNLNEYGAIEEIMRDAHAEGLLLLTIKGKEVFPTVYGAGAVLKPRTNRVERFKIKILEKMEDAVKRDIGHRQFSLTNLGRAVRGDNHPEEFKTAIQELIAGRKISEEKLWGKARRPTTYYHLFEF